MKDMLPHIATRKPGAKEEDIKAAEEKLGAAFLEQYRELCKLVNNPEIGEWVLYPIRDGGNPRKTWDDVVRQNTLAREEEIPEHLITIAEMVPATVYVSRPRTAKWVTPFLYGTMKQKRLMNMHRI